MEYIIIIISAVFVNNILLSQFLGICPFLGVSNKVSTAVGMSGAVCFVMALSTLVTYLLQYYVLNPLNIGFMQTIVFILVIAALVQMVEIIVAILVVTKEFAFGGGEPGLLNLAESVVYAVASALGFGLAMTLMAGIREQLELAKVPEAFRGVPIALIIAGIMAMAFMGFSGIV